jgi:hypothetical protein
LNERFGKGDENGTSGEYDQEILEEVLRNERLLKMGKQKSYVIPILDIAHEP